MLNVALTVGLLVAGQAPVESLTLEELVIEDLRLELDDDPVAARVMMGTGFGVAAAGAVALGASIHDQVIARNYFDAAGDAFGDIAFIITDVFAAFHAASGLAVGVSGLWWLRSQRSGAPTRAQVRARITELELTGATYDRLAVAQRQADLIDAMAPTYALPALLLVSGIAVALAGGLSVAVYERSATGLTAGVAELTVGAGLTMLAVWLIHYRGNQRAELHERATALRLASR